MTAQHSICRLCFDSVEENCTEAIDEGLTGMLQTVLTRIDLSISENPVLCNKCHRKLEANYNFKRKCIFTEDTIKPFITENVKVDLNEIYNEIFKSEDIEDDKNVCRLCFQFVDNDMTLSDTEKEQFQQFFPEINLSRLNFVVVCSVCYDHLQKYFIFVTSCWTLEQQLCNYFLDNIESKIDIVNEPVRIKLENFQEFIKKVKEEHIKEDLILSGEDKKEVVLNEELDIKCDTEEDNEQYNTNYEEVEQFPIKEEFKDKIDTCEYVPLLYKSDEDVDAKTGNFKCEQCNKALKSKEGLKYHMVARHTDLSNISWYKCESCDRTFRLKQHLQKHISNMHIDPSKITWYQCEQCNKKFKHKEKLKVHKRTTHIDSSEMTWYKCELCDKKFKLKYHLQRHVLDKHTDPSEITWYQCEQCDKKFKRNTQLRDHVLTTHTDPFEIFWYQCEYCDRQFKLKQHLQKHLSNIHIDPSEITWHQCTECNKKFKYKAKLKAHIRSTHN